MGHANVVKVLLSYGVSPDEAPPRACKPLHEAVAYSQHACAELLLSSHADTGTLVSMIGSSYHTVLTLATSKGDRDMVKLLLKYGADPWHRILDHLQNTGAHICANGFDSGSIACLRLLLEYEPRLALARNSHGRTPLHYAAGTGNIAGIRYLTNAGAKPNAVDINGMTPLQCLALSS
jgi:ankyrin repeat protein